MKHVLITDTKHNDKMTTMYCNAHDDVSSVLPSHPMHSEFRSGLLTAFEESVTDAARFMRANNTDRHLVKSHEGELIAVRLYLLNREDLTFRFEASHTDYTEYDIGPNLESALENLYGALEIDARKNFRFSVTYPKAIDGTIDSYAPLCIEMKTNAKLQAVCEPSSWRFDREVADLARENDLEWAIKNMMIYLEDEKDLHRWSDDDE